MRPIPLQNIPASMGPSPLYKLMRDGIALCFGVPKELIGNFPTPVDYSLHVRLLKEWNDVKLHKQPKRPKSRKANRNT